MLKPVELLFLGILATIRRFLELDFMEYANDAAAQAAYVTDGGYTETVDQEQTSSANAIYFGDIGGAEYRQAQSFQLSGALTVTAVEIKRVSPTVGSPSGNWTLRIETDSGGVPSGTLANANASIVVSPPAENTIIKGSFATPFALSASTTYHIVVQCDNQTTNYGWDSGYDATGSYASGNRCESTNGGSTWSGALGDLYFKVYVQATALLQSYSEATIKTQGSYALKVEAAVTDSLNKTLTRTLGTPKDLSGAGIVKVDMRSSRIGANIKVGLHDTGGTTTEFTPTLGSGWKRGGHSTLVSGTGWEL